MRTIVLDTNCLLVSLPKRSPYHNIWTGLIDGSIALCVSNEILSEYEEKLTEKTSATIAENVIQTVLNLPHLIQINPTYFWRLIQSDLDDNKYVDCAICGEAELIVTNDSHFNILKTIDFPKVFVQSIEEFARSLKEHP